MNRLSTDYTKGSALFLNGELVDVQLTRRRDELQNTHPSFSKRVHLFNSVFFTKLTELEAGGRPSARQAYSKVAKWTKRLRQNFSKSIFDMEGFVFPINRDSHWTLGACIISKIGDSFKFTLVLMDSIYYEKNGEYYHKIENIAPVIRLCEFTFHHHLLFCTV